MNIDVTLQAMKDCALWAGTDEFDEPLDSDKYAGTEWELSALKAMIKLIDAFTGTAPVDALARFLEHYDESQLGHDLWLTMGGYGAGFSDREGVPTADGHALTDCARSLTHDRYVYLTDNGTFDIG